MKEEKRMSDLKTCNFLEEARKKEAPNVLIQLLLFLGIYIAFNIVTTVIMLIGIGYKCVSTNITFQGLDQVAFEEQWNQILISSDMMLLQLFVFITATMIAILFAKGILKRNMVSMGFVKTNMVSQYIIGLVLGALSFGGAVLIGTMIGALKFQGYILNEQWGMLLLFFVGFIIQGMGEEVMVRGYLMPSLAARIPLKYAILISSLVFAALHLLNPGMTILSFLNLSLFGIFAGIYMCKTQNIWGISAFHTSWNFVQGNFFGILVSGQNVNVSVFSFDSMPNQVLLNGGNFGMEGGIIVTILLLIACGLLLLYKRDEIKIL